MTQTTEPPALDPCLAQAYEALQKAQERGWDPVETLHSNHLLLTQAGLKMLRAEALSELADLIQQREIMSFLDKHHITFTDYKNGIVNWLREQSEALRKEAAPAPAPKGKKR